jgi:hypothetical protein
MEDKRIFWDKDKLKWLMSIKSVLQKKFKGKYHTEEEENPS